MNGVVGINKILMNIEIDEVKHVLNIKIYQDRLTRLITLSRNVFLV